MKEFTTPILFIVFNRPETTERVFQRIREARPKYLFIAADGPRTNRPEDVEKCRLTREIVEKVDWPCEVKRLYRDDNLGCKVAPVSAIGWFFDNVDQGIILEDDCLPSLSFFYYCQGMLKKYVRDERIMMISGINLCGEWKYLTQDYHFSYYGGSWGWATWKRAWILNDIEMKSWKDPSVRKKIRASLGLIKYLERRSMYQASFENKIVGWDYQWSFARLSHAGLSVVPAKNLISNIGFSNEATHSTDSRNPLANRETFELTFPLRYNQIVQADKEYDSAFIRTVHNDNNVLSHLWSVTKWLIKAVIQ